MSDFLNTKHFTLLEKSVDFRVKRQNVLASNVANMDTPGYRAEDLVFEKALGAAMHADEPGPLHTQNSRHMDGNLAKPIDLVQPERIQSAEPFVDFNDNTVDVDKEMSKIAENQLMYEASMRMLSHQFKMLKTSLTEGG